MNIATTTEKKTSPALIPLLSRILPTHALGKVLVWCFLPTLLFLLTLGISFLNFCPYTLYLPFFILIASALTIRYRTQGLSASYVALSLFFFFFYKELPQEGLLWQMGIIFTVALTIFILLLAVEETESCIEAEIAGSVEVAARCLQTETALTLLQKTSEEQVKELQDEIAKLKDEAEQRKIERAHLLKQCDLIHSEIEWLNSQKDVFVTEAREARGAAIRYQLETEALKLSQEGRGKELEELIALHQKELERQREEAKAQHQSALEEEKKRGELHYQKALQEELNQADDLYQKYLEEQKREFEKTIGSLKKEILSQKEAVAATVIEQKPLLDSVEVEEMKKTLAQARGQYGQLRYQFEQKSATLTQTRKELFETEGKLLALEREQALLANEPSQEVQKLHTEIEALGNEIDRLDSEISSLEELLSHLIS